MGRSRSLRQPASAHSFDQNDSRHIEETARRGDTGYSACCRRLRNAVTAGGAASAAEADHGSLASVRDWVGRNIYRLAVVGDCSSS